MVRELQAHVGCLMNLTIPEMFLRYNKARFVPQEKSQVWVAIKNMPCLSESFSVIKTEGMRKYEDRTVMAGLDNSFAKLQTLFAAISQNTLIKKDRPAARKCAKAPAEK